MMQREREGEKENLDDAGGVTEAVSSDVVSEDQVLAGSWDAFVIVNLHFLRRENISPTIAEGKKKTDSKELINLQL